MSNAWVKVPQIVTQAQEQQSSAVASASTSKHSPGDARTKHTTHGSRKPKNNAQSSRATTNTHTNKKQGASTNTARTSSRANRNNKSARPGDRAILQNGRGNITNMHSRGGGRQVPLRSKPQSQPMWPKLQGASAPPLQAPPLRNSHTSRPQLTLPTNPQAQAISSASFPHLQTTSASSIVTQSQDFPPLSLSLSSKFPKIASSLSPLATPWNTTATQTLTSSGSETRQFKSPLSNGASRAPQSTPFQIQPQEQLEQQHQNSKNRKKSKTNHKPSNSKKSNSGTSIHANMSAPLSSTPHASFPSMGGSSNQQSRHRDRNTLNINLDVKPNHKAASKSSGIKLAGSGMGGGRLRFRQKSGKGERDVQLENRSFGKDHSARDVSFLHDHRHEDNMLPMGVTVKGKQKIGKRKKLLTPLKKQILKERLRQWRESQDAPNDQNRQSQNPLKQDHDFAPIVYLKGYVNPDELEDEEEYEEIERDLQALAEKVGAIQSVFIPRDGDNEDMQQQQRQSAASASMTSAQLSCLAFVHFKSLQDAMAATACWHGMVLGGEQIHAGLVPQHLLVEHSLDGTQGEIGDDPEEHHSAKHSMHWTKSVVRISLERLLSHDIIDASGEASDNTSSATSPDGNANETHAIQNTTVILTNVLTEDDLEDEDCIQETREDIECLASQHGSIDSLSIDIQAKEVRIKYQQPEDAHSALTNMNGMVIGGLSITAKLGNGNKSLSSTYQIQLENILTEDDYEDEECLEATKEDVALLAKKFGQVVDTCIHFDDEHAMVGRGRVGITYTSETSAMTAVKEFDGMVIGGLTVKAFFSHETQLSNGRKPILLLRNVLTEDDYEDEECMGETKGDVMDLLQKFGTVDTFDINLSGTSDGSEKGDISVTFTDSDNNALTAAAKDLNGYMIGGCKISAQILNLPQGSTIDAGTISTTEQVNSSGGTPTSVEVGTKALDTPSTEPMYSGDKVIPEMYAECKRAPKIPNPGVPREYAKRINDDSVVPLLFELLSELMRLQLRAKALKNNSKARRRLVVGLREVCRGIRARKVKMVVMANNVDQYGALDEKLQEILDLAREHELPVIYELNKRKLGKALGKSIKVSVVGIENADGAHAAFKKLKSLYGQ